MYLKLFCSHVDDTSLTASSQKEGKLGPFNKTRLTLPDFIEMFVPGLESVFGYRQWSIFILLLNDIYYFRHVILILCQYLYQSSFHRCFPFCALKLQMWNICVTNDHGYVTLVVNTSRSFPHS